MYVKIERPLDQYSNLMALLPFDRKMPPVESASQAQIDELNVLWSAALMRAEEIDRPPYIFKSGGTEAETATLRYQMFLIIRDCLRAILEVVAQGRAGDDKVSLNYCMEPIAPLKQRWCGLFSGGIRVFNDPQQVFLNCLEATGEEIWNLRACPVCGIPFLPRREDQKACSMKCSSTLRLRNYRRGAKAQLQKRTVGSSRWKGEGQ